MFWELASRDVVTEEGLVFLKAKVRYGNAKLACTPAWHRLETFSKSRATERVDIYVPLQITE